MRVGGREKFLDLMMHVKGSSFGKDFAKFYLTYLSRRGQMNHTEYLLLSNTVRSVHKKHDNLVLL